MALKEKILDRAQKYILKGYLDKAIQEYKAASEVDPRDISIRLRIGDLHVKTGNRAEAAKEYTEAARANTQRGFYLKAIAVYKQVLKLEDSLDVHYKLAELYTKQKLIADAISEYSFILSSFEKKGKNQEAVDLLKKMIEVDPENNAIRLKLAEVYRKQGFEKDALSEYISIFGRMLSRDELDKAERFYVGLSAPYSGEAEILRCISEVYRRKGDKGAHLKYARLLLGAFKAKGEIESAKEVSAMILEASPGDRDASMFMEEFAPKPEAPALHEPLKEEAQKEEETPILHIPELEMPAPPALLPLAPEEIKPLHSEALKAGEVEIAIEGFEEKPIEAVPTAETPEKGEAIEVLLEGFEGIEAEAPEEAGVKAEAQPEMTATAEAEVKEEKAFLEAPEAGVEAVPVEAEAIEKEEEEAPPLSLEPEPEATKPVALAEEALPHEEGQAATPEPIEVAEIIKEEAKAPPVSEERQEVKEEARVGEEVDLEKELSEAISELKEKIEPEDTAPREGFGRDALIEAQEEAKAEPEQFIDLSRELGMEEALEGLTESWGEGETKEAREEFKTSLGKQLSREDSETHYNLGIAYMEMGLHGEAEKEFKIAMQNSRLEFDCYTRLGLCAMAEQNPEEAILYYLKGLKIKGKSDEERKGLMYELALAYEASGKTDEARQLFESIHDADPYYREIAKKVRETSAVPELRPIPSDDDLIEVELL
jgi:tetratricopeptide (TPR) repeat protein